MKKSNFHLPFLANQQNLLKLSANFETDPSDHHHLIATIMKLGSLKEPLERLYKNFDINIFNNTLKVNLDNMFYQF